ncbi:folylpolyglutamate synthase/dihydrofolate synthase family protein [Flagellimonas halotolerans]|uniref:Dihydrofolate synthase/folylpolyglutamate synthase n=1 Tax=Flagellimonas halotolerans TaxID=3112164 RepID=A0ABU6IV46_9FLAO|nr:MULTISPECIES: folylpolyglutamate synthase/dihydrofolate synthase family protein [unclassified Allomuricauda]MEC3967081.1 folylpolyglutamate synthase/dihydrofolate synthase family protein [Muricauda sp. SYSU M86414]MEC4266944.1 folylpolyglutamate synthase/dihydrofolate synthase family protein [Muricauda sp. SYSU M84420]
MTYKETLDWMFGQLPMYQQKGAAALNAKLDNIIRFSNVLGNPEKKFKSIHVAGTNGKGSSSHMLASILQEAGYKVGLYTSPHLKDFRERIKINGKVVSKKFVTDFIQENKTFFEYHKLSFFEMTVGLAFSYFAEEKVDIAIIEVGLGGRLDSTNIITPEVSLITNIGIDHTQFLGDTLEKIALEKAGIIKPKVPVVISETQPETKMIFNLIAHQRRSNIVFADAASYVEYKTDLLGEYQQKNINGVVACIRQLKNFEVAERDVSSGLTKVVENTGLLGRWQVLQNNPLVVCDTAHNKEGLQLVLEQVKKQSYDQLHIVLGFVKDKDVKSVLPLFPKDAKYYFVRPSIPRGMYALQLEELAQEEGLKGKVCKSVKKGLNKALKNATSNDMIYVGGSTFVVAEIV